MGISFELPRLAASSVPAGRRHGACQSVAASIVEVSMSDTPDRSTNGASSVVVLLLATACERTDLPPGWEGAFGIADLVQTPCEGTPYDDPDEHVEVDFDADPLAVAYRQAHFRCAQEVEAFGRRDDDALDILVQPIDMHPKVVAGCDCLYDIDMRVAEYPSIPDRVSLYRRWDDWNVPNHPVLIGSVTSAP
jgi:hypothetical protein